MKKIALMIIMCISFFSFAEDVKLEYHFSDGSIEVKTVNSNLDELYIYKTNTTKVLGLDQLKNLNTIIINRAHYLKDYSFLSDAKNLEVLVLIFAETNSFEFLTDLEQLKALIVQSSKINNYDIDLSNNNVMEYLELSNCNLLEPLNITGFPCSLSLINYAYNSISDFFPDSCNCYDLILSGNPIAEHIVNDHVITSSESSIIPDQYRRFLQ
ncbi:MAG: hypothetical protein PQJ59_15530 [Spirochaetales bacterium]|nr:hypothetical protein [Spirochaetales bacterium]